MLQIEGLSWHTPAGEQILDHIDLCVPDGKLTVVTGPNGGGKTTLAKLIAGLEKPDSGKIYLDGEDITDLNVTERARRGIGYAFQQPVRFKGLTVRDLVELAAGSGLNEAALCDLLGRVGLCARDYIDREVDGSLSGGEIKRIEIATVLARHTRLSVFDEPEAGIDLWSFAGLIDTFRDLRGKVDGALLIISHQERILSIADEIVVVAEGKIREQGTRERILPSLLSGAPACGRCPKEEVRI
ncbi:MAG TPA: ATP-binding cassette domain-containing protein [Firmicutes bacterium]|nr:ATP-binding cassette domain-containing protein [Bacillota bacterium]